jgi:bacterioferritin (cytochrome b1)
MRTLRIDSKGRAGLWVSLDEETARRLQSLADICHASEDSVAASLLHDILKEDEDSHTLLVVPAVGNA